VKPRGEIEEIIEHLGPAKGRHDRASYRRPLGLPRSLRVFPQAESSLYGLVVSDRGYSNCRRRNGRANRRDLLEVRRHEGPNLIRSRFCRHTVCERCPCPVAQGEQILDLGTRDTVATLNGWYCTIRQSLRSSAATDQNQSRSSQPSNEPRDQAPNLITHARMILRRHIRS
jgi:hypothetical protein